MDQNKKIVVIGVAVIFIIFVAVFLVMIVSYDPPKKEAKTEKKLIDGLGNIQKNNDFSKDQKIEEKKIPDQNNKSIAKYDKVNILIRVNDLENKSVVGLICQLSSLIKEPILSTTSLYNIKTDSNGECYFYDLDSEKSYWVEFFSETDRTFYSRVDIDRIEKGQTFKNNITVNLKNYKNSCTDTDEGYNPDVAGTVFWKNDEGIETALKDACVSDFVMEVVCDSNGFADNARSYKCLKGCKDGACIK